MPWSELNYPPAMAGLSGVTRSKAIDIANAMLRAGDDEGKSIRVAIAQARRWARRRFEPSIERSSGHETESAGFP